MVTRAAFGPRAAGSPPLVYMNVVTPWYWYVRHHPNLDEVFPNLPKFE